MTITKPALSKGTRDYSPEIMIKRNYILDIIKTVFEKYAFLPLETPAIERLDVLTGKYGEEGDQLIFKILNSGDFLSKVNDEDLEKGYKNVIPKIAKKALRYDLTVPFARFVTMNRGTLTFPFRRYQIQSVWRGDRPQKGRYQEFQQCDADVVGTDSLICEAEIILMINEVLGKLGIDDFSLKINNRKILSGIAEVVGQKDRVSDMCVAIDKLDKIGTDKVLEELLQKGFTENNIEKLKPFLDNKNDALAQTQTLKSTFEGSEIGQKGLEEIEDVFNLVKGFTQDQSFITNNNIDFDITLARGLSYYTGAIFEVKVNNVNIGSISGGGRYDNLTGNFGMPDMSGVGFSFGIDRIFDVMEELKLFPSESRTSTQVIFSNFDKKAEDYTLPILMKLRQEGIKCEIYPKPSKLKKQMTYANSKGIPFVVLVGEKEMESQKLTLKNMESGEQEELNIDEVIEKLKLHFELISK